MLVKEGKLKWDDPVIKYLPDLQLYDPYVTRELTIRDLLCHRQGYSTWEADLIWYGSTNNREEVLKQLRFVKPVSSFRSQFGYSNMMFLAAGQIISSLSGMSWDDFIKERFFKPLEMTRSNTSIVDFKNTSNIATPHTKIEGKIVPIQYRNVDNVAPCGSINSSVHDIAQWIRAQLGKGVYNRKYIIDSNVIFETRNPFFFMRAGKSRLTHFSAYGLGWFLKDYNGRLVISHGGGMDGMLSQVGLVPEENLGIVVLTNYDGQSLYVALLNYIIDAYLGLPLEDLSSKYLERTKKYEQSIAAEKKKLEETPIKGTKPTLNLKEYSGNYANEILGEAVITEKNDGLYLQFKKNRGLAGPLKHWYYDTFLCKWEDTFMDKSLVTFIIDVRGQVEEFRVKIREDFVDPLEYVFKKTALK
jgi:CubicO group peptidase (beta-lactamase class C family)